MLLFSQAELENIADSLLEGGLDPIPRHKLLSQFYRAGSDSPAFAEAKRAIDGSRWVRLLESEQRADGTWGRFHSQDSAGAGFFRTTENAVQIAVELGIGRDHRIFRSLMPTLEGYVSGELSWPDRAEKHDDPAAWPVWVKHFSAALLALIDADHPLLEPFGRVWADIVAYSFSGGEYCRQREIEVSNELLKVRMKDPFPFNRKHPLLLLSSGAARLDATLEKKLLARVMEAPEGIYYVYGERVADLRPIGGRASWRWLQALKLLSRFRTWRELSVEIGNHLWSQRLAEGLWDLGPELYRKPHTCLPLSESWRPVRNRIADSSIEILLLLARHYDEAEQPQEAVRIARRVEGARL